MSVPHRTPTGVKVICLVAAVDAVLNLGKAGSLILDGDPLLPWPVAAALGVGIVGQSVWQLGTVYGLYMLKPSAYRQVTSALKAGLLVDVLGLFLGRSSMLDLGLTVAAILYLFARRDTFVPAGKR